MIIQGKDLDDQVDATLDRLLVEFGKEILKIVPGRVSTEVDARFSFDQNASITKALHIIDVSWLNQDSKVEMLKFNSYIKPLALARSEFSSN